jgi:hypothetical protein
MIINLNGANLQNNFTFDQTDNILERQNSVVKDG